MNEIITRRIEGLRGLINDIDMKVYHLKQDENTPQIIVDEFLLAREHLGKAYKILCEDDY